MSNKIVVDRFFNDILQPIAPWQISDYIQICSKQLPHAIRAHHYLRMQDRWLKLLAATETNERLLRSNISPFCINTIYSTRSGNKRNCTFIAISDEAPGDEGVSIVFAFTLQESCEELREIFAKTKRIDWNRGPLIASIHPEHRDVLMDVLNAMKGPSFEARITWDKPSICVWLAKEKAVALEYDIPAHVYLARLREEHSTVINSVWPHRSASSLNYIRSMINLNADGCIGLFDSKTNVLLSWLLTNDNLAAGNLQTIETAQRRGLATLILRIYCKEFATRENLDVIAYYQIANKASATIFASLGFEEYRQCSWVKMKHI